MGEKMLRRDLIRGAVGTVSLAALYPAFRALYGEWDEQGSAERVQRLQAAVQERHGIPHVQVEERDLEPTRLSGGDGIVTTLHPIDSGYLRECALRQLDSLLRVYPGRIFAGKVEHVHIAALLSRSSSNSRISYERMGEFHAGTKTVLTTIFDLFPLDLHLGAAKEILHPNYIHHELAHALMNALEEGALLESERAWSAVCNPPFTYWGDDHEFTTDELRSTVPGFSDVYGQTHWYEDFASVAAALFHRRNIYTRTDPQSALYDEILADKVALVQQIYERIDARFDARFWEHVKRRVLDVRAV